MKIEIFPSGSGDCLLITSSDDKRILVDGGLPDAYSEFIAAPLAALRNQNNVIDVAYVSHIDRDHIGGILRMLDDEMSWRVAEHLEKKGRPFKQPTAPRPPKILQVWHNAFLESVAKTQQVQLSNALSASANAGDESLMHYLKSAGLLDANGTLEVDVLKVPHHGAHNSYSKAFVECVRARHYIFCGDGKHHNPEPDVVKGYLDAIKKAPLAAGGDRMVHFNWSLARTIDHLELWKEVEAHFTAGTAAKRLSLGSSDTRLTIDL